MANSWLVSPDQSPGLGITSPLSPPGESIVRLPAPQPPLQTPPAADLGPQTASGGAYSVPPPPGPPPKPGEYTTPVQTADNIRAGAPGKNFQPPPTVPDQFSTDPPGSPPPGAPPGLPAGEAVNTTKDTPDDPPGWGHYKGIITQYENDKRDPYLGWGDTDLRGYPLSPTGFPQWPGKPGPDGNSTAAGIYQIEKSTWDPIAARLGIKDFSPESQERVAKEIYRERGLQPWAAFNPKLATAVGYQPQMADYWNQRAEGAIGAEMGIARSTAAGMSAKMQEYARIANAAAPGSKEADEALASLRKEAAIDRAAYREKMMKPPVEKPVDAWANFGSVATIMGLLGGLFTRQHITGALNAAGAAMEAINTNNHQIFEQSYKTWHDQTEMAHTLFQMDQEDIKDILTDKRMGIDEKTTRLLALSTELGMMKTTGDVLASPYEHLVQLSERRETAARLMEQEAERIRQFKMNYDQRERMNAGNRPAIFTGTDTNGNEITFSMVPGRPETAIDSQSNPITPPANYKKIGGGGDNASAEKAKAIKQGITEWRADPKNAEWIAAHPGQEAPHEVLDKLNQAPGRGAQAAQTVQVITGAASELTQDLENAMHLPIAARLSMFMGVENATPDTLTEGLQRTLARKALTPSDAIDMGIVFQGIQRELGILENQGRATGIVGLSDSNKMLIPQEGWTPKQVLLAYAQMKQIGDKDLEAYSHAQNVSPDQKNYMQELRNRLSSSVPFEVQDILRLEVGNRQTVRQFAEKLLGKKGDAEHPDQEQGGVHYKWDEVAKQYQPVKKLQ